MVGVGKALVMVTDCPYIGVLGGQDRALIHGCLVPVRQPSVFACYCLPASYAVVTQRAALLLKGWLIPSGSALA